MALYTVNVEDIVTRENTIAHKIQNPIRREPFYQAGPETLDLPVIQIEINLPVYRMANWRTRTRQLEHVHRESLPTGYFQSGEEDVGPQRTQHEILIEFAKRGRGESIIPILTKLKSDRKQMETLLVTSTGVVVNGNRRLAGMGELFAEDPAGYPFQSIQVAVLPASITAPELKKIEFQLQMQQETKLPYDWAIQCLAVRELKESGTQEQEIMHLMRLNRKEEVTAMITRLNEAEIYLRDYLDKPDEYAAIEKQEQQFIELQRALDRKNDAGEKEIARKLCHVITKHSRELDSRAYDFKLAFGPKATVVAERLADRMNVPLADSATPNAGGGNDDDLFDDEVASLTTVKFSPVRELLADRSRSEELAGAIRDICIEIHEEDQDDEDSKKPLRQVKKVKALLASIEIGKAAPDTIESIRSELDEVIGLAEGLLAQTEETSEKAT